MKQRGILFLIMILLLASSCRSPLASYRKALSRAPYDVIIVPGIPYHDQNWESNVMKTRVLWSYFLYSRGIARNVIYSGNAVYSPYVEGKIMAYFAIALGIPAASVFSETTAEHSTENLVYSCRMAKKLGFKKIAVATDPYQSAFLKTYAWDCGLDVEFIPAIYDSLKTVKPGVMVKIDPAPAFIDNFIPLPERENFLVRMLGTMGMDIRDE